MDNTHQSPEIETKNKISGSKWSWIIGSILVLGSVPNLLKHPVTSFLCIIAGLFIIPPITKAVEKEVKRTFPRSTKILVVLVALAIAGTLSNKPQSEINKEIASAQPEEKPSEEMNLEVSYLPNQKGFSVPVFGVKNVGNVRWEDCMLRLNDRTYTKDMSIIVTEATFKETIPESTGSHFVMATEFTKKDGTRFNPYTTKPVDLSISCKKPTNGFGYWKFN